MSEDDWRRWVPEAAQRYLPRPDADWTQLVPPEWRRWLDASPAPRPQTRTLRFIGVDEDRPGPRWLALYEETVAGVSAVVAAGRVRGRVRTRCSA